VDEFDGCVPVGTGSIWSKCIKKETYHSDSRYIGTYKWVATHIGICHAGGKFETIDIISGHKHTGTWHIENNSLILFLHGYWKKTEKHIGNWEVPSGEKYKK
jgi:hypothetical protein